MTRRRGAPLITWGWFAAMLVVSAIGAALTVWGANYIALERAPHY